MKKLTNAWLEFAARDLNAAKKLVNDEYLANIVLFHSQQTVEKCLKAILKEHEQNVPRIHGVNKLYSLITENTDVTLLITEDELDFIDDVYIDTRYPSSFGILPSGFPKKDEATSLFNIAERVYQETCSLLVDDE